MEFQSENSESSTQTRGPTSTEDHRNEGFLKSAWQRLIHQQDSSPAEDSADGSRGEEKAQDEPKKAAGSGS